MDSSFHLGLPHSTISTPAVIPYAVPQKYTTYGNFGYPDVPPGYPQLFSLPYSVFMVKQMGCAEVYVEQLYSFVAKDEWSGRQDQANPLAGINSGAVRKVTYIPVLVE
jgi:hypothetical protein